MTCEKYINTKMNGNGWATTCELPATSSTIVVLKKTQKFKRYNKTPPTTNAWTVHLI